MRAIFLALILGIASIASGQVSDQLLRHHEKILTHNINHNFDLLDKMKTAVIKPNPIRIKRDNAEYFFKSVEAKREAIEATKNKILELKSELYNLEGKLLQPTEMSEAEKNRIAILKSQRPQLFDKGRPKVVIPQCKPGEVGIIRETPVSFEVIQVLSKTELLANHSINVNPVRLIVESTEGITDGSRVLVKGVKVLDTYVYESVAGAKKTVPSLQLLSDAETAELDAAWQADRARVEADAQKAKEDEIKEQIASIREKRMRDWSLTDGTKIRAVLVHYELFPKEVCIVEPENSQDRKEFKMADLSKEDQAYVRKTLGLER